MPIFDLKTNVVIDDPKAFALEFSKFSSATLEKPEEQVNTSVIHVPTLTFGGTFDPAFTLQVVSLTNLSPEKNIAHSKAFFDFFEKRLGIPNGRGYITFVIPKRDYLGVQATTAEVLLTQMGM